jgi:outer membrane protein with beta-barrel domain
MCSTSSVRLTSLHVLCVVVSLGLAALAVMVPGPASAATHPHARGGWLVGLGIGGASAGVSIPGVSADRELGGGGSLRVGYAFSPRLSLELDGTAWTKEQGGQTITFSAGGPTLNFYPGETGLVMRAGVGVGTGEASQQFGSVTVTGSESGLGLLGGIGYEFRVTPRFALGPGVNVGWINLDSFDANWVTFELGATWYFIKQ